MFDRFYSHNRHGHASAVCGKVLGACLGTAFIGHSMVYERWFLGWCKEFWGTVTAFFKMVLLCT